MTYDAGNVRRSPRKKSKHTEDKNRRRKLDFCNDRKKPLHGFKVFLDITMKTTISDITKRIEKLGGSVENFLSKEIKMVITNQKVPSKTEAFSQIPSPLSMGPSPLQPYGSNKYSAVHSPFSTDSLQHSVEMAKKTKQPVVTRGKSLLDKVLVSKRGSGTADIAAKAKNFGAVVFTVEEFMKKFTKRTGTATKTDFITRKEDIKPIVHRTSRSRTVSDINVYELKETFFKIEDQSRAYRPVLHEAKSWPTLYFQDHQLQSPFALAKETKSEKRTCDAQIDKETMSGEERSEQNSGFQVKLEDEPSQKAMKERQAKPGYCDICTLRYQDLHKHLRSDQHRNFAKDDSNFKKLDILISNGTDFNDFIKKMKGRVKQRDLKAEMKVEDTSVVAATVTHAQNKTFKKEIDNNTEPHIAISDEKLSNMLIVDDTDSVRSIPAPNENVTCRVFDLLKSPHKVFIPKSDTRHKNDAIGNDELPAIELSPARTPCKQIANGYSEQICVSPFKQITNGYSEQICVPPCKQITNGYSEQICVPPCKQITNGYSEQICVSPVSPCCVLLQKTKVPKSINEKRAKGALQKNCKKIKSPIVITSSVSKRTLRNMNSSVESLSLHKDVKEELLPLDDDVFNDFIPMKHSSTPNKCVSQKTSHEELDNFPSEKTTKQTNGKVAESSTEKNDFDIFTGKRDSPSFRTSYATERPIAQRPSKPVGLKRIQSAPGSTSIIRRRSKKKKRYQGSSQSQASSQVVIDEDYLEILRKDVEVNEKNRILRKRGDVNSRKSQKEKGANAADVNEKVDDEKSDLSDCLVSPYRFLINERKNAIKEDDPEVSFNTDVNPIVLGSPTRSHKVAKTKNEVDYNNRQQCHGTKSHGSRKKKKISIKAYYGGTNDAKENVSLGESQEMAVEIEQDEKKEPVTSITAPDTVVQLSPKDILLHIDLAKFAANNLCAGNTEIESESISHTLMTVPGGNMTYTPQPDVIPNLLIEELFKQGSAEEGKCFMGYLDGKDVFCNPDTCTNEIHGKKKNGIIDFSDDDDEDVEGKNILNGIFRSTEFKENQTPETSLQDSVYHHADELYTSVLKGSTPKRKKRKHKQQRGRTCSDRDFSCALAKNVLSKHGKENEVSEGSEKSVDSLQENANFEEGINVDNVKKRMVTPIDNDRNRKRSRTDSSSERVQTDSSFKPISCHSHVTAVEVFGTIIYDRIKNRSRISSRNASESISRNSSRSSSPARTTKKRDCGTNRSVSTSAVIAPTHTIHTIVNNDTVDSSSIHHLRRSPRKRAKPLSSEVHDHIMNTQKHRRVSPRKNVSILYNTYASTNAYKHIGKKSNTSDQKISKSSKKTSQNYTAGISKIKTPFSKPKSRELEVPSPLRNSFEFDEINESYEQHYNNSLCDNNRKKKHVECKDNRKKSMEDLFEFDT